MVEDVSPALVSVAAALQKDMPQLMEAARVASETTADTAEEPPANMMLPVPGSHPVFNQQDFVARMHMPKSYDENQPYPAYSGTANSVFALAMTDAFPGAPVSWPEVHAYQQTHFAKCKPQHAVVWKHAVTVVVAEGDASRYNPAAPQFRVVSMNVMIFAFLQELQKRLQPALVEGGCIPIGFLNAARHVPVNYVLIPASAQFEEHVYIFSLQIMENFREAGGACPDSLAARSDLGASSGYEAEGRCCFRGPRRSRRGDAEEDPL